MDGAAANNWQQSFAAAVLDPDLAAPAGLAARNGSDVTRRFNVYRNNVVTSLVDALAEKFPVTCALVGEEFFRAMARIYVTGHPPQSRVLAEYGADFGHFIDGFEHAREVAYLGDVARLEHARTMAYHGADGDSLAPEDFATIDGSEIAGLRLRTHPTAHLLASRYAVVSLWAAHQQDEDATDLSGIDPFQPESALVIRPDMDVLVFNLPPGGADFLAAIIEGRSIGEAAAAAAGPAQDFDIQANLAVLMQSGLAIAFINCNKE